MTDETTSIGEMKALVAQFAAERNWAIYHTPKNLASSVAIEAAELMEHFQWLTPTESDAVRLDPEKKAAVGEEMADVLSYLLEMANRLDLDLANAFFKKQEKNAIKYPKDS